MNPDPPSPDTFPSWEYVLGNSRLKEIGQAFVTRPYQPHNHILVYGANRSGKTCNAHLMCQAKFCRNRDALHNPCQGCPNCRRWLSGAGFRNGRYTTDTERFDYLEVDCTDPKTFDEEAVILPRGKDCPLILFLDEVSSPAFAPIVPRLLKPMMELCLTIIACGVRVKAIKDKQTGKLKPGLLADFRYRFSVIEKTTTAAAPEFLAWLDLRRTELGLDLDDLHTLEVIREKSLAIPGQALRLLRKAAFLRVGLTRSFVEAFLWDAE